MKELKGEARVESQASLGVERGFAKDCGDTTQESLQGVIGVNRSQKLPVVVARDPHVAFAKWSQAFG